MAKKSIENTEQRRDQGGGGGDVNVDQGCHLRSGDPAPKKHRNLRAPWQLGQSGNPAGRKVGSRNRLAQDFIDEAYEDWKEGGKAALRAMREKHPEKYCVMMAALIPQHFKVEHEHSIAGLSEDELRARLLETRTKLLDSGIDPSLLGPPPDGSQSSADGPGQLSARRNRKTPSIN